MRRTTAVFAVFCISIASLSLLLSGCKTTQSRGAAGPASRAITVTAAVPATPPQEPKARFVVQIMKADTPLCFSPDGRLLLATDAGRGTTLQLWDVASGRLIRTFPPDRSKIAHARVDPKGRYLLVVNDQGDIRLVDIRTGLTVAAVDPEKSGASVKTAEFAPDGRHLLIRRACCTARLFDIENGAQVVNYTIEGMTKTGECLLSPDGRRVLFGVGQKALKNFRFQWHDLHTGQKTGSFTAPGMVPDAGTLTPVISPDGRYLVRKVSDYRPDFVQLIEIIDIQTRQVRHIPESSGYLPLQISADSRYLFTAIGIGNGIQMWELATGRKVSDLGPKTPFGYAVSPVDPVIACGVSMAGAKDLSVAKIDLYDFEKGESRKQITGLTHFGVEHQTLQFLSDGSARIGDRFIDLRKGTPLPPLSGNHPVSFSRDGARVMWFGRFQPLRSGKELTDSGINQYILCSWPDCADPKVFPRSTIDPYWPKMMSTDGSRLMAANPGSPRVHGVWNLDEGAAPVFIKDYPYGDPGYWRADLTPIMSPDGKMTANGYVDGHTNTGLIYLWDASTGKKRKVLKSSGSVLMQSLAFSPDSRLLAAAITAVEMKYEGGMGHWLLGYDYIRSFNRTRVEVWNMKTMRRSRTIENIGAWVQALSFSPDGRELFVGGQDGLVHRFDTETGDLLRTYPTLSPVSSIAVSPDGMRMLVSGFGESYWDLAAHKKLYTVFSPVGPTLPGQETEHLTWTPEGYYQGSDRLARSFVHLVNGLETYAIDQFFEQFYNPAMVEARAAGLDTAVLNIAEVLDASPPPKVEILPPKIGAKGAAVVEVLARDTGGGVREVRLFHNGKRIGDGAWTAVKSIRLDPGGLGIQDRGLIRTNGPPAAAGKPVPASAGPEGRGGVRESFPVQLLSGENIFRAVAFSGEMIESEPVETTVAHRGNDDRGVLHLVAVGIEDYRPPLNPLPAARGDAETFVQQITHTAPKLFGNFKATTLYDVKATRAKILKAMAEVEKRASAADTLVFFFAGHGVVLESDGRFYLVAQGVSDLGENSPGAINREGVSDLELGSALQRIPAVRQVVFLDACQSGGADFASAFRRAGEEVAVKRVGRAAGTWVFSAAGKAEYAWETPELGHGLFTHSLLAGMTGEADMNKDDGGILLSELETFVRRKVAEYARQLHLQQQPVVQKGFNDFPIAR